MFKRVMSLLTVVLGVMLVCCGCGKDSDSKSGSAAGSAPAIDQSDATAVIIAMIEAVEKSDADALYALTDPQERGKSGNLSKEDLCGRLQNAWNNPELKTMLPMIKAALKGDADEVWKVMPQAIKQSEIKRVDGDEAAAKARIKEGMPKAKDQFRRAFQAYLSQHDGKWYVSLANVQDPMEAARFRAQMSNSTANLKMIGLALIMYSNDNRDYFPEDLSAIVAGDYLGGDAKYCSRVLIAPFDKISKPAANDKIQPQNTSYAYIMDKSVGMASLQSPGQMPVAFEKPWIMPDMAKGVNVLYADGHVEFVQIDNVNKMSCQSVVSYLLQRNNRRPEAADQKLLQNAAKIDRQR